MSDVFVKLTRTCDRCNAEGSFRVRLGQRDGQLTGDINSTDDWNLPPFWHYVENRYYRSHGQGEYLCPECFKNKEE